MKEINKDFINNCVQNLDKADIELSQIPDINLYMEQLLDFINSKTAGSKRVESNTFTKAMINNYTKAGLLNPPNNKKYNREHIILLLLINQLKQVLSINDIKTLYQPILQNMDKETISDNIISIEDIYETFLELKDNEYSTAGIDFENKFKIIKEETKKITNEDNQDLAEIFLTVIMLVAEANIAKRLAEEIIDKLLITNNVQ
jgi:DNA-binding transcriptional MerR regulator